MNPKNSAMHAVLADMGRAAMEGRARRFQKRPMPASPDENGAAMDGAYGLPDRLGAPSPAHDMAHSGPQMSQEEMDELMGAAR